MRTAALSRAGIWNRSDTDPFDGFGQADDAHTAPVFACAAPVGYTPARGDCDDADATIHPGAEDAVDDGTDRDCGGSDIPDPHVGLTPSSYPTLSSALEAAHTGVTVWVGPGTYLEHDINFQGRSVRLESTDGAEATVVDAQSRGPVMRFTAELRTLPGAS